MHLIKKYTNRKLYDATDKRYIKVSEITDLIQSGEEVTIIDNHTGEDITADIVTQQLGENVSLHLRDIPSKLLFRILKRKNGMVDFTQNYVTFLKSTLSTLSGDRTTLFLEKNKEHSTDKEGQAEDDVTRHIEIINDIVDMRVEEILKDHGVAAQEQMDYMSQKLDSLSAKLESYENIFSRLVEKILSPDSDQKKTEKNNQWVESK